MFPNSTYKHLPPPSLLLQVWLLPLSYLLLILSATRAVCAEFSKRIVDRFETREEIKFNLDSYKSAVEACLEELGSKPITKAKEDQDCWSNKRDIQRSKLLDRIAELGLDVPEEQSITNLKKIIGTKLKADKKAERGSQASKERGTPLSLKLRRRHPRLPRIRRPLLREKTIPKRFC